MELAFARNLTRLEKLSPKLQILLFKLKDDVVNYYLASRDDLLINIQEELVTEGKFLEQWAKGKNREVALINKVLRENQYEEVALALVSQINLDCFSVEELLRYENWLIAWRLLQLEKLCPQHKVIALGQVIGSISLTSNDKILDELVIYLKEEVDLWILVLKLANLDQLNLVAKIPSSILPLLTSELELTVSRDFKEWADLMGKNYYWKKNLIVEKELQESNLTLDPRDGVTVAKVKSGYEKVLKLLLCNLSHTAIFTHNVASNELSIPHLQEIVAWEKNIELRNNLLIEPKIEHELVYLKDVEEYPHFKGNDPLVCSLAFKYRIELSQGFYIKATTLTTKEMLNRQIASLLEAKNYILLDNLLERYPEAKVQNILFLDFLLTANPRRVVAEGVFEGLEEYLIHKSEDISLLIENEVLLEKILIYIEEESEVISNTMLNLLPEWVCSLQGLKDFAKEVNQ